MIKTNENISHSEFYQYSDDETKREDRISIAQRPQFIERKQFFNEKYESFQINFNSIPKKNLKNIRKSVSPDYENYLDDIQKKRSVESQEEIMGKFKNIL